MRTELEITLILIAYLVGSIPFGFILTKKFVGKNILKFGSGNIGSTNVRRIAGRKVAILTQLCDMFKGLLPIGFIIFLQYYTSYTFDEFFIYAVALAVIVGHDFSIFLKFKGGKGVNTTLGASVLLIPISVFSAVLVYFLIKWRSKYVSLSSICLALTLSITELIIHKISYLFYYSLICSGLIIFMHHSNIRRLIKGTEIRSDEN